MARCIIGTRERLNGTEDDMTLWSIHTLAEILDQQGQYQEALSLYERAYVGTEKRVGASHSNTIFFQDSYNRAKHKQHERAEASRKVLSESGDRVLLSPPKGSSAVA